MGWFDLASVVTSATYRIFKCWVLFV